jgi:YVTN family beta-propeller protein
MTLKPDGGELFVCNFDSGSVSVIETAANEVGGSYLIGTKPVRGLVTSDNALLYTSNFGSGSVSVFSIDTGRMLASIRVGQSPEAMALTRRDDYLFVVNTASGDVAVIRAARRATTSKISADRALVTMIPVGSRPNAIAIKP